MNSIGFAGIPYADGRRGACGSLLFHCSALLFSPGFLSLRSFLKGLAASAFGPRPHLQ
jgi:hypothetical protein